MFPRSYRRLHRMGLIGSETSVSPLGLASCRSSAVNAPMSSGASNAWFRRPTVTCVRIPAPRAGRPVARHLEHCPVKDDAVVAGD